MRKDLDDQEECTMWPPRLNCDSKVGNANGIQNTAMLWPCHVMLLSAAL